MKRPRFFVGVDPSITNTGISVLDDEGKFLAAFNAGAFGKDRGLEDIVRHLRQKDRIEHFFRDDLGLSPGSAIRIAWEDYSFNSPHKAYSLAECNGILKAGIMGYSPNPIIYVPPMRLKKFATGNGHADKSIMIDRAKAECKGLGEKPTSDICDAYFLAKYAFYVESPLISYKIDKGNPNLRIRLEICKKEKGVKNV